jgi:hypothetical protein
MCYDFMLEPSRICVESCGAGRAYSAAEDCRDRYNGGVSQVEQCVITMCNCT